MRVIVTIRWNKPDIPHKEWEYVGMEDLGKGVLHGEEIIEQIEDGIF